MVVPNPYRHARPVSPGVATGAVVGVAVVLWWRWVLAALWGAVLAVAAVGALRLLTGAEPTGDRLDTQLAMAVLLGFWGAVAGIVVWWRRCGRPGWLGARWWPVYVLGGLMVGALMAVALVGVAPGGGLLGGFLGGLLGLAWALVRHARRSTAGPSAPGATRFGPPGHRRAAARRGARVDEDPAADDEVTALLRRVGLEDDDPRPSRMSRSRRPRPE